MRLDARARQDLAILESQFLKLNGKTFSSLSSFKSCPIAKYMLIGK